MQTIAEVRSFQTVFIFLLFAISTNCVNAQDTAVIETNPKLALELASIFSDHMVLQRDLSIPVWGTAEPGTAVRVHLNGKTQTAIADKAGRWRVSLGPMAASGPHELQIITDGAAITLTDVHVGEVWVCSGQSNMQWPMQHSSDAKSEIATADFRKVRFTTIPRQAARNPQQRYKSWGWHACKPATSKNFSAVAYHFGKKLYEQYEVPIGLISTNYGGTPMEAWTSYEALTSRPIFSGNAKIADTNRDSTDKLNKGHPTGLYNAMIHPLIPYGIRGVIWYQGEANAWRHANYRELSELMISDWRSRWGQGDFPFLLVQLAGWKKEARDWPYLREAQLQTMQTVDNVGMVVTTDVGDVADIHPRNKKAVGERLALAARKLAYGEELVHSGPIYKQMESRDGAAYLDFDHTGGGLQVGRGGMHAQGSVLQGFEIAGKDRKFVPAVANIIGKQVKVSSEQIASPTSVRYNWSGWTEGNLYNAEGLPASPFRTDRY